MDRWRHLSKAVLILAVALGQGGCGLFDTRDPTPPQGPIVPCLITSSPDNILENIRVHYGQPSVSSCYSPMLDSLFEFHPDQVDSTTTPEPFRFPTPWTRMVEDRVATNIASDSVITFSVVFDSTYQAAVIDPGPPQRETRFYQYHILFLREGSFRRYQGRMEITFEQKADLWKILYWIDHADGSNYPTWGRLRANYRIGI